MIEEDKPLRVLHSFPHRLGKGRICTTAWYEIDSVAAAGAEMKVMAGDSVRPFPARVKVNTTFRWGKLRAPYKLLGARRMCILHDRIVARRLSKIRDEIDIIHAWPLGALHTIREARRLGIPVGLERCNAHTRFAYEVVQKECDRIGVPLPPGHEHAFDPAILALEEEEYAQATALLCPSDFTAKTFSDRGFPKERLARFIYGVDETIFHPGSTPRPKNQPLRMIYVGVAAVRKGLHFALEAWLESPASQEGEFWIVGGFIPAYRDKLAPMLSHRNIKVLGHRDDVPALMRDSDIFIMPSIEEGFGLVCTEALASGCVPLVSEACTDLCRHQVNSLVHPVGDVKTLADHITLLQQDRELLGRLRENGLNAVPTLTWEAAGRSLIEAYKQIIALNTAEKTTSFKK